MGETVALPNGRIEVEERPGYLYVVEHGTLLTVGEVERYADALETLATRAGLRRALIDSRHADTLEPSPEVREAMWSWLVAPRCFDQIAFVLPSELAVVRVNMLARSHRAGVCAFGAVHEAHRWLTGRQRSLSQTFSSPLGSTATPVPPPRAESGERTLEPSTSPGSRRTQVPPTARSHEDAARPSSVPPAPRVPGAADAGLGRYSSVSPSIDVVRRSPSQRELEAATSPRRKLDDER